MQQEILNISVSSFLSFEHLKKELIFFLNLSGFKHQTKTKKRKAIIKWIFRKRGWSINQVNKNYGKSLGLSVHISYLSLSRSVWGALMCIRLDSWISHLCSEIVHFEHQMLGTKGCFLHAFQELSVWQQCILTSQCCACLLRSKTYWVLWYFHKYSHMLV